MSSEQQEIHVQILRTCARFDENYWLERDRNAGFLHDLHRAMADDGWLGIAMPEAVGGPGLGITEATVMMQAIAETEAGASGASTIHMNIFWLNPVVKFGTDKQRARMLGPLIAGDEKACFVMT
ncbi:MAG: acyl-CoA dehydrogenase family protein [Sneathiella sp.]|nr:acyl-CoA dehydrogenase family protein [Sneathiella sp.]